MIDRKRLFGMRVKSLRERKGWTQEYLAEKMDISMNYLSSMERGKENPTFDMLMKISDNLEVEMWEIFDFGHEISLSELRKMLNVIVKEVDDERLKSIVKVVRAMVR